VRRQNPPQYYLDYAWEIEKYLNPLPLAAIYCLIAFSYCALVALLFAGLVYASVVNPTAIVITMFAAIALVPAIFLILAWFLRPDDPLSSHLSSLVEMWRNPITLLPEVSTFTIMLFDGEQIGMKIAFYYPSKNHTPAVKDRLYTCVHTALANSFSGRASAPTGPEIERAANAALETLALEYSIPVLYMEVEEILTEGSETQPSVHAPLEYLRTGT
jgi:hypothetical protein